MNRATSQAVAVRDPQLAAPQAQVRVDDLLP
jgi:hypothetical protein